MDFALPTLNINQPVITDEHQAMIALLKFLFWNPGWTSSQIEATLLSMRKLRAETAQDIPDFPQAIQTRLDAAVKRYRPDWTASVTYEMISTKPLTNTYRLLISITDSVGQSVVNMNDFVVEDGEIKLKSDLKEINTDEY